MLTKEQIEVWAKDIGLTLGSYHANQCLAKLKEAALLGLRNGVEAVPEKRKRVCCGHDSDCAVHNEPAMPAGECDCGYAGPDLRFVDGVGGGEEVQEQFGLENKNGKLPEELRPIEVIVPAKTQGELMSYRQGYAAAKRKKR